MWAGRSVGGLPRGWLLISQNYRKSTNGKESVKKKPRIKRLGKKGVIRVSARDPTKTWGRLGVMGAPVGAAALLRAGTFAPRQQKKWTWRFRDLEKKGI